MISFVAPRETAALKEVTEVEMNRQEFEFLPKREAKS